MPVVRVDVEFKVGCSQGIRYAYAEDANDVTGDAIVSLAENFHLPPVQDFYCARRTVQNGFNVSKEAFAVHVRLNSSATQDGVIGVNIFHERHVLFTEPPNFDGFPSGSCS